jgi:hypothetical protein
LNGIVCFLIDVQTYEDSDFINLLEGVVQLIKTAQTEIADENIKIF